MCTAFFKTILRQRLDPLIKLTFSRSLMKVWCAEVTSGKRGGKKGLRNYKLNPDFEAYCFVSFATIPATVALSV